MIRKIFKFFFILSLIIGLVGAIVGGLGGWYFYNRITRDLPQIEKISDYRPKAATSLVADDGTLLAEYYDERRYPVTFEEIPKVVRNAFLAAEDANFYNHPGIDITSVFRAMWVNLRRHSSAQGASTITQQIVKSLLLTKEKTYERKVKEAILSYRIEKSLTKDQILTVYLNEIYLGLNSFGVKAAARAHFHKELDKINIAEAAYLAGLPKKPSELANPARRADALGRQKYVIGQMLKNNMISQREAEEARNFELKIYPVDERNIYRAPYFAGLVMRELPEIISKINHKWTPTNPGGFTVKTSVNLRAYDLGVWALQKGLREIDKRRGWRGPLKSQKNGEVKPTESENDFVSEEPDLVVPWKIYPAVIREINKSTGIAKVFADKTAGTVDLKNATWANRFLKDDDNVEGINVLQTLKVGDVIEVSLEEPEKAEEKDGAKKEDKKVDMKDSGPDVLRFQLDQTPQIQGAFVLLNAQTGETLAVVGGYDYQRSIFNRAFQGLLQPGSSFKPIVYLTALEQLHLTPVSIVPDSPISLVAGNGKIWSPQNFDHKYLGPITLRTALQKSRNVVSVYLLQRSGLDRVIETARRLGLTTPIEKNMSIALGTPTVHLLELARAYGAFAAEGRLADMLVVSEIKDRDGTVIYSQTPRQTKVISEEDAFIMAHMMRGVVDRGTATLIKKLNRPVAGKTGTTNDQMDAWFIGYTPQWVGGVWVGFDVKRSIGNKETGGKVAAPVFLYFMQEFLKGTPIDDFVIPDGVIPVPIDLNSGHVVDGNSPGAFIEYFKTGTEPKETAREIEVPQDYLSSDEF